ncbi:MAG TPA: TIGR02587 family membrane protein [Abditibacteriaceae bacterium]|nr:TIGR02587 family membrane protein [Abditibacteriaceae bacterium]
MIAPSAPATQRSVTESLQQYARGVAGGLIFSLPLLYTMEMWWMGFIAPAERLIACVLVTFVLLLGYNRYAGMRRDATWLEVAIDSVEEMGLGLVVATGVLFLLGQLTADMAINEIMGKIVLEAMTVAIGVSVGTAQLGSGESNESGGDGDENGNNDDKDAGMESDEGPHFGGQLVIALCGAVLFAANVAPTEEIIQIGIEASTWRLLGLAALSFALAALILYGSNFRGAQKFAPRDGPFPILCGTIITYGVALAASGMILWFFGRFDGMGLLPSLKQIVVLSLPAALGASGGRLLLQAR